MASITTDDVTTERVAHSGAVVCSAIVTDDAWGFDWREAIAFYDYDTTEAVAAFVELMARRGYRRGED